MVNNSPSQGKERALYYPYLGLGAGLTVLGMGTTAPVTQQDGYQCLCKSIDEDIPHLESSALILEAFLDSLAEVVLQNRRGLDLLLLQQKGQCMAPVEECCSYANKIGIIRQTVAKIQDSLLHRQKEHHASQGWFESWFSSSP